MKLYDYFQCEVPNAIKHTNDKWPKHAVETRMTAEVRTIIKEEVLIANIIVGSFIINCGKLHSTVGISLHRKSHKRLRRFFQRR